MENACELPYFEGDFWPTVLEEIVVELEKENNERQEEEDGSVGGEAIPEGYTIIENTQVETVSQIVYRH